MSASSLPINPEVLIAQRDFARRLATALLRDTDAAEDVAQTAWLRTREFDVERRWRVLPAVVRNLVHNARRGAARRKRRDREAARREALPSAADVLAFEAQRRSIVDAVLRLAEPYRGTVLAVYLEGRTPTEVARGLGVPAATVRSRLSRGLDMLRSSLRTERGRGWRAALVPLALGKGGTGALLGGTIMTKKIAGALAGCAVLAWAGWLLLPTAPARGDLPPSERASPAIAPQHHVAPALEREPLAAVGDDTPAAPRGGLVLLADGSPAADLPYWFAPSTTAAEARRARVPVLADDVARTGMDGSYQPPSSAEAWLWIRVDPATDVAVAVRGDGANAEVVLPELAWVDVQLLGVPPGEHVDVALYPSWTEHDGEHVQAIQSVHQHPSGVHRLCVHRSVVSGAGEGEAAVRLRAVAGVEYDVDANSLRCRFPHERAVVVPPARLTLAPLGIRRVWQLRVVERDRGPLSDVGGLAMLQTDYGSHRASEVTRFAGGTHDLSVPEGAIDRLDLTVVLEDGEWFAPPLPAAGAEITLLRGRGRDSVALRPPPGAWSTLYLVGGGEVAFVAPLEECFYQDVGPVRIERDGVWRIVGAGDDWRRAIAIAADGRVASCERTADGEVLRALPAGDVLPALSPADVAARYPEIESFWLRFELQPPGLPSGQWLVADRAAFSRTVEHGASTWHKVQTPGVPFRVIVAPAHGEAFELSRWW